MNYALNVLPHHFQGVFSNFWGIATVSDGLLVWNGDNTVLFKGNSSIMSCIWLDAPDFASRTNRLGN
jgi:hypothetical protein